MDKETNVKENISFHSQKLDNLPTLQSALQRQGNKKMEFHLFGVLQESFYEWPKCTLSSETDTVSHKA